MVLPAFQKSEHGCVPDIPLQDIPSCAMERSPINEIRQVMETLAVDELDNAQKHPQECCWNHDPADGEKPDSAQARHPVQSPTIGCWEITPGESGLGNGLPGRAKAGVKSTPRNPMLVLSHQTRGPSDCSGLCPTSTKPKTGQESRARFSVRSWPLPPGDIVNPIAGIC